MVAVSLSLAAQNPPGPTQVEGPAPTGMSLFPVTVVWTLALNNALTAPPAYEGTRGYFPIEGNRLAAYDLTRGTRRWVVSAHTSMEPAAGDGLLFIVEPGRLVALRALDGSIAWQRPFAEQVAVPLVWDNGWLVAATSTGGVLAFRASDGELIWRHDTGAPAHAPPTLAADRVYVPTRDARVVALRVENGAPIWDHRLGDAPNEILALDDRLYLGSQDDFFYCLNTSDGREEWRWRTGADARGRPVVDDRTVYFVSLDNVLRALNRHSGVQRWKSPLPLRPTAGPVRAGDTLVVTGLAPTLRAYNTKDGKAAGDLPTNGEIAAPPYVFDDPSHVFPVLVVLTRNIANGATVTALTRSFEPAIAQIAPLPNVIPLTPIAPISIKP